MQVESVTSKKQVNNHYVHNNWVGPSIGYRIKIDKKLKSFHKKKNIPCRGLKSRTLDKITNK